VKSQLAKTGLKGLKIALALCLAGLFMLWLTDALVMPMITHHNQSMPTPEVVGLDLDTAKHRLEEQHFKVLIEREMADPTGHFQPGQVMEQFPRAAQRTKSGRRVYLTVCSGGRYVTLPDLRGVTFRRLLTVLSDLQLKVDSAQVQFRFDERYAHGTILDHLPVAGDSLLPGSSCDLVLSLGVEKTTIKTPELMGLSQRDADWLLRSQALTLGKIMKRQGHRSAGVQRVGVLDQLPHAGEDLQPGAAVQVWFQDGDER
jgi:beta-lactam-binding protein with PASTA domain